MTGDLWAEFERAHELDFSYDLPGIGRFRVNVYRQRCSIAISIRAIVEEIPTLAELGLPDWLSECALRQSGLILISAATGQGKTTTLGRAG